LIREGILLDTNVPSELTYPAGHQVERCLEEVDYEQLPTSGEPHRTGGRYTADGLDSESVAAWSVSNRLRLVPSQVAFKIWSEVVFRDQLFQK